MHGLDGNLDVGLPSAQSAPLPPLTFDTGPMPHCQSILGRLDATASIEFCARRQDNDIVRQEVAAGV